MVQTPKSQNLRSLPELQQLVDLTIHSFQGPEDLIYRLKEQGFVEGTCIRILEKLPLGGPILVEVKGAIIALRTSEAKCILI
jgi:Fe2+ transport system protein FeoA